MTHALLISTNTFVISEFQKIAALAKVKLAVAESIVDVDLAKQTRIFIDHEVDQNHPAWNMVRADLNSRAEISLVLAGEPTPHTWQLANSVAAEHIALLPESRQWLVEYLSTAPAQLARAVVFASVAGGSGMTTAALALSRAIALRGQTVVVVDLDFYSTGFDIAAGAEKVDGLKWSDVLSEAAQASGEALVQALPAIDGVRILGNDSLSNSPELSQQLEVINRIRQAADWVLIDSGRHSSSRFMSQIEDAHKFLGLVNTIRSCGLARELLSDGDNKDTQLIIRELPGSGLSPLTIAQTLNHQLVCTLPSDSKICELSEQGLVLTSSSVSKYNRAISQIMRAIAGEDRVLSVA
jgi:secretion/DNA translocation related CpaE-like protein